MANNFDWVIENEKEFQKSIDALGRHTSDFRIPFRLISSDFYRSQRQLFSLKTEGMYPVMGGMHPSTVEKNGLTRRENAENRKEKLTGHPWAPLLYGESGDLRDSTLTNRHPNSIYFLGRQELEIGTDVPYGKFHQSDGPRSTIPHRKFVFIDGSKGDKSKGSGFNGRRERWKGIIQEHIKQLVTGRV